MSLDIQRKKLELKRVLMAKEEMEFHILERKEDIARLERTISIQLQKANELEEQIKSMEGNQ